jgi:MFS family permease
MTFLVQYYQVKITGQVLGFDKYIFILAPAIILAAVFTFFYGKVYDKFGFIKAFVPSISLLIIGLVILFIFSATDKQIAMKFIGSLLMMCGYLGTTAVFNAMIRDNTPKGKVGLYQGIRIIAQVLIPMLIGPWLGAVSLSGNFTYDESAITGDYSYPLNGNIFICAAIVMVITLIYVVIIYYTQIRKNKEEA